jgi:hypothetical protein
MAYLGKNNKSGRNKILNQIKNLKGLLSEQVYLPPTDMPGDPLGPHRNYARKVNLLIQRYRVQNPEIVGTTENAAREFDQAVREAKADPNGFPDTNNIWDDWFNRTDENLEKYIIANAGRPPANVVIKSGTGGGTPPKPKVKPKAVPRCKKCYNMDVGCKGPDVAQIQQALIRKVPSFAQSGAAEITSQTFGPETGKAVKAFKQQGTTGLKPPYSSKVGPSTGKALGICGAGAKTTGDTGGGGTGGDTGGGDDKKKTPTPTPGTGPEKKPPITCVGFRKKSGTYTVEEIEEAIPFYLRKKDQDNINSNYVQNLIETVASRVAFQESKKTVSTCEEVIENIKYSLARFGRVAKDPNYTPAPGKIALPSAARAPTPEETYGKEAAPLPTENLEESKNWIDKTREGSSNSLFERLIKDISNKKTL